MNEITEDTKYDLNDRTKNIKNGYVLQVKNSTVGFIAVLLFGPFGYLYYGWGEFWDKFKMLFIVIIVAIWAALTKNGLIDVLAWIVAGSYCFVVYLSPLFEDDLNYTLTAEGIAAKSAAENESETKKEEIE